MVGYGPGLTVYRTTHSGSVSRSLGVVMAGGWCWDVLRLVRALLQHRVVPALVLLSLPWRLSMPCVGGCVLEWILDSSFSPS